jgi:DNA-binding PadR family transcriptional regulator
MAKKRSPSTQTLLVLRALLDAPDFGMYGLQICQAAGLASGTIHPILARLEGNGFLNSTWEDVDPHEVGRPQRRYYSLSKDGAEFARAELAAAQTRLSPLQKLLPGISFHGGLI